MVKITYESILARAISDCSEGVKSAHENVVDYLAMGKKQNADYFYREVYLPLQEELDGLKQLYQIETGRPFNYREED